MDNLTEKLNKMHLKINPIDLKTNPIDVLVKIIENQTKKEEISNIWNESIYKDLPKLQSNNVGNVGEMLIQQICENQKIKSSVDGTKTKKIGGGKDGDGTIKNKSVEIKTSHLGSNSITFQHELGEHPWNADYMIFIDIAPKDVYITIFKNFTEEQYKDKSFKCEPYFPTKSITQRKGTGNFKLDTSIKINELCVENKYSIKLTDKNINEIGAYINQIIN